MGPKDKNKILNFKYNLSDAGHIRFLQTDFDIGMIPQSPGSFIERSNWAHGCHYDIDCFLQGKRLKVVTLIADNIDHQLLVYYGLKIELFPSPFLGYFEYGLETGQDYFSSMDSNSVRLLMEGVEQALCKAFNQPSTQVVPSTQIEVPRKKNFSQLMGDETVTIIVGEGEGARKFVIHKDFLMNKVAFFEKMFSSKFLESSTGTATLPEDSPEAFEVLVEWIYCSTLKTLHGETTDDPCLPDLAISIIGLAEKYMLPELGDRAITYLANVGKELVPTMGQMSTLYEQTPSNSKARKYAARTVAWALINSEASGVSTGAIQQACQDGDLLFDAITEVRGRNGHSHGRAHTFPVCDYHNHDKASKCPYEGGQEQTAIQRIQNRNQQRNHYY